MTLVRSSSTTSHQCARSFGTAGSRREVVLAHPTAARLFRLTALTSVAGPDQFDRRKISMSSPLRLKRTCCPAAVRASLCLLALILLVGAPSASAQLNGSIQTTFNTGTTVNGNIYPSKALVYLNGGPQNESSAGLDNGTYYFQVTDPSGAHLLSTDDITCRQVLVVGGRFAGHPAGSAPATCTEPAGSATPGDFHANGLTNSLNGSIPIQLCAPSGCPDAGGPLTSPDFENTDNGGGEYKVWITPIAQYGLNGISAKTNW